MKFTIQMKDPDGPIDCINSAVDESLIDIADKDEKEAIRDVRFQKLKEATDKWFRYGEYLTVEFDTDKDTATVLKATK